MWSEPGMCSPAYSAALRTSRTSGGSGAVDARRQLGRVDQLESLAPAGASVRQAVIPPSRKPSTGMPTAASSSAASRSSLSEAATQDHRRAGRRDPRDLGREAGVVGGGAEGAGDVGLVELLVGAAVDHDGAGGDGHLDLVRREAARRAEVARPAARG